MSLIYNPQALAKAVPEVIATMRLAVERHGTDLNILVVFKGENNE